MKRKRLNHRVVLFVLLIGGILTLASCVREKTTLPPNSSEGSSSLFINSAPKGLLSAENILQKREEKSVRPEDILDIYDFTAENGDQCSLVKTRETEGLPESVYEMNRYYLVNRTSGLSEALLFQNTTVEFYQKRGNDFFFWTYGTMRAGDELCYSFPQVVTCHLLQTSPNMLFTLETTQEFLPISQGARLGSQTTTRRLIALHPGSNCLQLVFEGFHASWDPPLIEAKGDAENRELVLTIHTPADEMADILPSAYGHITDIHLEKREDVCVLHIGLDSYDGREYRIQKQNTYTVETDNGPIGHFEVGVFLQ